MSVLKLNDVGLVPTIDIGEDYDIHPINKLDVGKRLALAAEKIIYSNTKESYYPMLDKIFADNNTVHLNFEKAIVIKEDDDNIKGFELSENGIDFKAVNAIQIDKKTIQISHLEINAKTVIRYLWKDAQEDVMIYNKLGIPMPPFERQLN